MAGRAQYVQRQQPAAAGDRRPGAGAADHGGVDLGLSAVAGPADAPCLRGAGAYRAAPDSAPGCRHGGPGDHFQTVRNEIGQLVSGIEHAVKRASEIEGVVHRELANLERSFGANEERIRTLLTGLDHQRVALQQAGDVIGQQTDPMIARLEQSTGHVEGLITPRRPRLPRSRTASRVVHRAVPHGGGTDQPRHLGRRRDRQSEPAHRAHLGRPVQRDAGVLAEASTPRSRRCRPRRRTSTRSRWSSASRSRTWRAGSSRP
jgi:hypothetical protein